MLQLLTMKLLSLFIFLTLFFCSQTVFAYESSQNFKTYQKKIDVFKLKKFLPADPGNIKNINPNLVNMDKFIKTVVEVNRKKGSSKEELKLIADALRTTIINSSVDYRKEFNKLLAKELADSNSRPPLTFFDKVVIKTLSFLGITPTIAYAQAGIPFGGAVIFPFFCPLSGNWMITIQSLPPSFATLLSYYPGTQGFASWNTPFTRFLLGTYEPVGLCIIPAVIIPVTIPTQGTITPMLGSSPF